MRFWRAACVVAIFVLCTGCQKLGLIKLYEYDERVDLSLDGSAVVDINGSIPALVALRGATLDVDPEARFDRRMFRTLYEGRGVIVREVNAYRRNGRRFVHVRLDVADIRRLRDLAPLAWSKYQLARVDEEFLYVQEVGAPAGVPLPDVGWTGDELIAFRVHMPSRVISTNAMELERGNTLAWEQKLGDRLSGSPLRMEARVQTDSILYRTLWLFAGTFASALGLLALVVWRLSRKGRSVVPA